jgi:DNA polymerase III delta subunit
MLYLFHGTDTQTSANKARALVKSLRVKRPDASFVEMGADDFSESAIQGHAGGQGLFAPKYLIFLDRVTENAEAKDRVADLAEIMQESDNIFILLEGKLNAELKRGLEKHAEKTVVSDMKKDTADAKKFNVFALADALGSRESGRAWALYRQAIDAGQETEAIIGMLFWKVKTMIIAGTSGKYAGGVGKYSKEELLALAGQLITVYHDGHRGLTDMELAIEQLLLGIRKS